jgi:hypothetical protein
MSYLSDAGSLGIEVSPRVDLSHLYDLVRGIVLTNSIAAVTKTLGYSEYVDELMEALRDYVGRFIEALAVEGTYVPGLASSIAQRIRAPLWELDLPDSSLEEYLSFLIDYRQALASGRLTVGDALNMLQLTCLTLQIDSCEELLAEVGPLTPAIALQLALTALAISIGGLGGGSDYT